MVGILAVLHLVFDSWRWEMIPAYAMGVAAMYILVAGPPADFRRQGR